LLLIVLMKWNPYAFRVAFAKRLVWICEADGRFVPVKATLDGIAYKTKDHGIFEFEREDVVSYASKPSILAYGPYSKANRPEVLPALQALKKYGIDGYSMLMGLLTAQEMTEADFKKLEQESAKA